MPRASEHPKETTSTLRRERRTFVAEARRQSKILAAAARDPNNPEAEEIRWLKAFVDQNNFGDE